MSLSRRFGHLVAVATGAKGAGVRPASDLPRLLVQLAAGPGRHAGDAGDVARMARRLPEQALARYCVADVMAPLTLAVQRGAPLPELARLLVESGADRALVLDGPHPIGMVTTVDVLRAVAREASMHDGAWPVAAVPQG